MNGILARQATKNRIHQVVTRRTPGQTTPPAPSQVFPQGTTTTRRPAHNEAGPSRPER
jgi:hypothetical protein